MRRELQRVGLLPSAFTPHIACGVAATELMVPEAEDVKVRIYKQGELVADGDVTHPSILGSTQMVGEHDQWTVALTLREGTYIPEIMMGAVCELEPTQLEDTRITGTFAPGAPATAGANAVYFSPDPEPPADLMPRLRMAWAREVEAIATCGLDEQQAWNDALSDDQRSYYASLVADAPRPSLGGTEGQVAPDFPRLRLSEGGELSVQGSRLIWLASMGALGKPPQT
ncbi:MAG: hypothetical protein QOF51_3273 [Chloroflexota bacterium]|jgi:hypothetical protein|nr:hypothetical protein [Chloroflexota bacterium]